MPSRLSGLPFNRVDAKGPILVPLMGRRAPKLRFEITNAALA